MRIAHCSSTQNLYLFQVGAMEKGRKFNDQFRVVANKIVSWLTFSLSQSPFFVRDLVDPNKSENSQMPRHLISDAHEWINEIPTVPIYYLAKPQQRERTL